MVTISTSHGAALGAGLLLLALGISTPLQAAEQDSNEALVERLETLEQRLQALEQQLQRERRSEDVPAATAGASKEGEALPAASLESAVSGSERSEPEELAAASPTSNVDIGGALRFNVVHRDFSDASKSKRGESGLDVFRLNVDGQVDNILISAEYRYYSYMQTIHHGWIGYEFEDQSQLQLGIHQVPFGLLPFAAHNAWFGVPYYVGLADDYDMGLKYVRDAGPWSFHAAFYKNEELNDATDPDRYSFDLLRNGEQQNEEVNQVNLRLAHTLGHGSSCENELGGSMQISELYNADSDNRGEHWAAAVHLDSRCGRWNFQLQGTRYAYQPDNPVGVADDRVRVGAFAASYDIASEADILVANLAYNFESPWPQVDQITCYNDYSRLYKDLDGARDSQINTLGCAVGSGAVFVYLDWIYANNMAFFDSGSLAEGGQDEWHNRFNINIGYYW